MLGEQLGTGLQTLQGQSADEHGGGGIAGDAQRQHGYQSAAGIAVVAGLRGGDALHAAGTELLRMLGALLGHVIGHKGGDVRTGGGDDADEGTDEAAHDGHRQGLLQVLLGGQHTGHLLGDVVLRHTGLEVHEHLSNGEQADHQRHRLKSAV